MDTTDLVSRTLECDARGKAELFRQVDGGGVLLHLVWERRLRFGQRDPVDVPNIQGKLLGRCRLSRKEQFKTAVCVMNRVRTFVTVKNSKAGPRTGVCDRG